MQLNPTDGILRRRFATLPFDVMGWFRTAVFPLLLLGTFAVRADVPSLPGWALAFSDDFNGAAGQLPSKQIWQFDTGHSYPGGPADWGTHEVQSYTTDKANISLDGNGNLRITPLRDAQGHWTSARLETRRDNFRPPAGGTVRMQARVQMPDITGEAALGYWPAFWALGQNFRKHGRWPGSGEFDIMENVNGLNSVWGTLHCGVQPYGPCAEPTGIGHNRVCPHASCQAGFHTYTFEWDRSVKPEALRWYVDGQLYGAISQNQLPPLTWQEITAQKGYFLLLDVAMGGDFAYALAGGKDSPTSNTVPGHPMVVDYVGVWTRPGKDDSAAPTGSSR